MTMAVITLVMGSLLGGFRQRERQARMDQVLNDMVAIADAALNYSNSTGGWPTSITDLAPDFIPAVVSSNTFGNPYVLVCDTGKVSVSSKIPAGLLKDTGQGPLLQVSPAGDGYDLVTITKREQIGMLGRLRYDKKYVYHE